MNASFHLSLPGMNFSSNVTSTNNCLITTVAYHSKLTRVDVTLFLPHRRLIVVFCSRTIRQQDQSHLTIEKNAPAHTHEILFFSGKIAKSESYGLTFHIALSITLGGVIGVAI